MSFIAGILLLNLDRLEAFVAFANLMNRPLQRIFFGAMKRSFTCAHISFQDYASRK